MQVLKNHCDRYLAEAQEARQKAGLCDGLFGMGKDPRKDPCHGRFYQTVENWTAEFLKQETAKELLQRASVWWGKEAVMLYISWDILPIMCCMPLPSGTVER